MAHLVKQNSSALDGKNIAREYLQARILGALQKCGAMIPLAFHGGTALRFLYAHGRYSEDLDFALEGQEKDYAFLDYLKAVQADLKAESYQIEVKTNEKNIVNNAFFVFQVCCMSLAYHRCLPKPCQLKSKWIPTRQKALCVKPQLCVVL